MSHAVADKKYLESSATYARGRYFLHRILVDLPVQRVVPRGGRQRERTRPRLASEQDGTPRDLTLANQVQDLHAYSGQSEE